MIQKITHLSKCTRQIALMIILLLLAVSLSACQSKIDGGDKDVPAKPSNSGGVGEAVNLTGDAIKGAAIFTANCVACHGDKGVGNIANPGSTDTTVPALNPVDETLVNADVKKFASNLDLFIEHGSTPSGLKPSLIMPAFGDNKMLTAQNISDVLAYIISLNKK